MSWQKTRPFIDILMGIMLVFEMFYTLTGNFLHEVVGVLFFATLFAHIILSRNWIKGITIKAQHRRKLSMKQKAKMGIIIVICIAFLLLLVSSVLISNVLSTITSLMLTGNLYSVLTLVHTASAYTVCIATICHVGFHWASLFRSLKIPYNPQRRKAINVGVTALASMGVVAVGIAAAKEMAVWNEPTRNTSAQIDDSEGRRTKNRSERKLDAYNSPEKGTVDNIPFDRNQSQDEGRAQNESELNSSICTLCHKRCSLSAPKCNKPFAAGLI